MAILVTGAAGFIGAAVSKTLLDRSDAVVGLEVEPLLGIGLVEPDLQV